MRVEMMDNAKHIDKQLENTYEFCQNQARHNYKQQ